MFAQDSIELLKTSGIDFDRFEHYGIDVQYFGELMIVSGLVLSDEVKVKSLPSIHSVIRLDPLK
jgi:CCR4-NOT transcription complex subunit 7/8